LLEVVLATVTSMQLDGPLPECHILFHRQVESVEVAAVIAVAQSIQRQTQL
jgi:hypothetical protein